MEFERVVRQNIEILSGKENLMNGDVYENNNLGPLFNRNSSGVHNNRRGRYEEVVEVLDDEIPGVIPTISNQVSNHVALANGQLGGKNAQQRASGKNGHVPNGRPNFRSMLEDAEMNSHI